MFKRIHFRRIQKRILAIALCVMVTAALVSGATRGAFGQESSAPSEATAPATEGPSPSGAEPQVQPTFTPPGLDLDLPPELRQFLPDIETDSLSRAPVRLDGRVLLQVAAPIATNSELERGILARQRAAEIERRLKQVAVQDYEPENLEVRWEWVNGYPLIYAVAETPESEEPQRLGEILTVTLLDAQRPWLTNEFSSSEAVEDSMARVADEWAETIQEGLVRFKRQRQPEFLAQRVQLACGLIIGMLALSLALSQPQKKLRKKQKHLAAVSEETNRKLSFTVEQAETRDVDTSLLMEEKIHNRQNQNLNSLNRRMLQLAQVAVWISGCFTLLGLFPYTRWLQLILLRSLQIPGKVVLTAIITFLFIRLSAILIDRSLMLLQSGPELLVNHSPRRLLRFSTFSSVAKSVVALLLGIIGVFVALDQLGVNVAPLLAGAGLVGFAISFAAQNLIRDLINGFLILIEDQFGVGDVIVLGDVAGFVEYMGLRITQLRNEEGRLITVPNGTITVVQNLTKDWSRVDLMIDVAHTADIDEAIAVILSVAEEMAKSVPWSNLILEPPLMLGVDRLDHMGATVRMWIKTQPLKQWDVAREYRRRLKHAFDERGIEIGVPQQAIRFSTALDMGSDSRDRSPSHQDGQQNGNKMTDSTAATRSSPDS